MKNYLNNHPWSLRAFCLGCLLFFLASSTGSAQSPVGNWDCVLSGHEQGVVQLFFRTNGTLTGRALYTFTGRTTGSFTNGGVLSTNIVGGARLEGQWSYASPTSTNRIVGFINGISVLAGTTTVVTNSLSFRGSVGPSKMDLMAIGYQGQVALRGIPLQATNDLTATYYGTGQKQGSPTPFVEIFSLTPVPDSEFILTNVITAYDCSTTNSTISTNYSFNMMTTMLTNNCVNPNDPASCCITTNITIVETYSATTNTTIIRQECFRTDTFVTQITNEFPINYYRVSGAGPGYEYTGYFLFSRQKYAAFFQDRGTNSEFITVYAGGFNPATGRGSLVGTDGVSRNIRFVVAHGPP